MKPKTPKPPKTPVAALIDKHFPGKRFRASYLKSVGKKLKNQGEDVAVRFLTGKDEERPPNFQPPAKSNIVAQSRPIEEWPIHKVSVAVQEYVYGLTVAEKEACSDAGESSSSHAAWFAKTGVENFGYTSVQGLNKIFPPTFNRFDGVIKKVENRNEKKRQKATRINEAKRNKGQSEDPPEAEVKATDDAGYLLQPPGINHSVYGYQSITLCPYTAEKFPTIKLPEEYAGYHSNPDAPIPAGVPDRLAIPEGQPGHVPEEHRAGLSTKKHRRVRQWYAMANWKPKPKRTSKPDYDRLAKARAQGALLIVIRIDEDWVVVDARGLLRNVRWRSLGKREITPNELLDLFTGDPVLDLKRGVVTFTYAEGVVNVCSRSTTKGKQTKVLLDAMTAPRDGKKRQIGMVAVDLGQTNPIAAEYSRVGKNAAGTLEATPLSRSTLPDELLREIALYRKAHDRLEAQLREEAVLKLTAEQQAENARYVETSEEGAKLALANLGVDTSTLPWDAMTGWSTCISDHLINHGGDTSAVFFQTIRKGTKKLETIKRKDSSWADIVRPRLTKETREALNDFLWELKRSHEGYEKLSKRLEELARRAVNHVVQEVKWLTQCQDIVIVIEDLNVRNFHGGGKRGGGWSNFFTVKKENRWFMQALHKAFSDLAAHRGIPVLEVYPARTSITCLGCGHCDPENRDGEAFVCQQCGATFHADLEVATRNIARVALTGEAMPKAPAREQPGGAKKRGTSRRRKLTEVAVKSAEPTIHQAKNQQLNGTSRDPVYKGSELPAL
jgi:hypothetical protein